MFTNLVRIQQIRFYKSRAFQLGAVATVLAAAFVWFISFGMYVDAGIIESASEGNHVYYQTSSGQIFSMMLTIFCVVNITFMVCDYYKYRTMVNIAGSVHNRFKRLAADIAGVFLTAPVISLSVLLAMALGVIGDGWQNLFAKLYPRGLMWIYIGTVITMLCAMMKTVALSKIFRKKGAVISVYYLINLAEIFAMGIASGFSEPDMTVTVDSYYEELISAISAPGTYITYEGLGVPHLFSIPTLFMFAFILIAFWTIIATVADGRRNEL